MSYVVRHDRLMSCAVVTDCIHVCAVLSLDFGTPVS
jgi:hypothetical protein